MTEIKYRKLVMDMMEVSQAFSGPAAHNMEFERQDLGRVIKYKLRTMIPAEKMLEKTHTLVVTYPDGWMQALKVSISEKIRLPTWITKRYPIKYHTEKRTVTFKAYNLYPLLPTMLEDCGNGRQMIIEYIVPEEETK